CPDLVVPIGSQSIVGVPSLAAVAALDAGDVLDIVDPIGMPLLKVELQLRPGPEGARIRGPATEAPLLVLRNLRPEPRGSLLNINVTGWVNTSAMALAFLQTSPGGQERLEICSPDLSIFASLAQEASGKFVLRSGREESLCMIFHSTFRESQHDAITVTDGNNQVLSRTRAADLQVPEPGRFCSLQVFSGVDLGVVLCCLFFMEGAVLKTFDVRPPEVSKL
ncbi:unnamed protein product, partial [Symbiodinium necroappetens]